MRGSKQYELTDHLGNIRTVVPDIKEPQLEASQTTNYLTDNDNFRLPTLTLNNYYPYGMLQAGRSRNAGGYRFGYQGQEADNKIGGLGQHLNYTFRNYDSWTARFGAIDPLAAKYPHNSPYAFSENRVIDGVELEGLEKVIVHVLQGIGGKPIIKNANYKKIEENIRQRYYAMHVNLNVSIEVVGYEKLHTFNSFKKRKDYNKTDSYVIIAPRKDLYNFDNKNTGWEKIPTTTNSNMIGEAATHQFFAMISSDGLNDSENYTESGFKNPSDFAEKTIMHEANHPKLYYHPFNRSLENGRKCTPCHVYGNNIMNYNNSFYHDPFTVAMLRYLHGQIGPLLPISEKITDAYDHTTTFTITPQLMNGYRKELIKRKDNVQK